MVSLDIDSRNTSKARRFGTLMTETVDMASFIPGVVRSSKRVDGKFNYYPSNVFPSGDMYLVEYKVPVSNHAGPTGKTRTISTEIVRWVTLNYTSLMVIGFLQGEMSKTARGPVTVCNSCMDLMQLAIDWFEKDMKLPRQNWHWYIRANIPQPSTHQDIFLTDLLVAYWGSGCNLSLEHAYPKVLTYVRTTRNRVLRNEGSLIIEKRDNVFVQTLQTFVAQITSEIAKRPLNDIIAYMKGIFAAESCVNFELRTGHRRVFITACDENERNIFMCCLDRLGIEYNECKPIKDIVISRRKNLERMSELGLMDLHPKKHERFCEMLASYTS